MTIAVVLMNLGGPSDEKAIRPFLNNFFMDKNIIGAPLLIRFLIAKWIAWSRGRGAAGTSYGLMGGKSPILENTQVQAKALQEKLGAGFKVYVSMRYWHPFARDVIQQIKKDGADRVILLPLYPQYSTTTTNSSFEDFDEHAAGLTVEKICCYPVDTGFVKASAEKIGDVYKTAPPNTRLLFSAHGLPEKIITSGDPYQWQCEETAKAIVAELNIQNLDWQICYQSRVGPLKWIGPSTDVALEKAAADKVPVLIYPHAFVSEHVETIVEIGMEYREKAHEIGIPWFGKVDTVGDHPHFINGLAQLVLNSSNKTNCVRKCPSNFARCHNPCKG